MNEATDTRVESCGKTVEEHFKEATFGLNLAGVGILCPEAYQAVAEIAEAYRIIGRFEPHVPKPDGIGTKIGVESLEALQRAEAANATRAGQVIEGEVVSAETVPANAEQAQSAYNRLDSAGKKRYN